MSEWEKMNTFDNRIEMAQLFSWVPLEPHQIYHMVVYLDHSSSLVGSQTSKKEMSTNSKTKLGFPLNLAFGLLKKGRLDYLKPQVIDGVFGQAASRVAVQRPVQCNGVIASERPH
jgi:hypothetical protein